MQIHLDSRVFDIGRIIDFCPYCHKHIIPKTNSHSLKNSELSFFIICTNLACGKAFVTVYEKLQSNTYFYKNAIGGFLEVKKFSEIISSISPNFITIYNQAETAEHYNLDQISGVGFRKALEFLIKDYSCKLYPEKESEIKAKMLMPVINDYIKSDNIKNVAKRAVWLGNDETHYERKWEGKDVQSLKKLIDLTISWIETEETTRQILEEMPD
ncbi:hypothetical protein CO230_08290 [Chryseobacterium sp. 6424]|uniref:DUF4145 domain-containing protein n=1 Tax=Chryseobacterium sp. 6424 TaxID=2039166 RepID=UPI000EFA5F16|nr:DUF4145 domain-containing protein [Chryseobacterium sp. 6424]AYO58119.1 hypothetical protein CO230_08290 [Chryseobacterium sp. 6424]